MIDDAPTRVTLRQLKLSGAFQGDRLDDTVARDLLLTPTASRNRSDKPQLTLSETTVASLRGTPCVRDECCLTPVSRPGRPQLDRVKEEATPMSNTNGENLRTGTMPPALLESQEEMSSILLEVTHDLPSHVDELLRENMEALHKTMARHMLFILYNKVPHCVMQSIPKFAIKPAEATAPPLRKLGQLEPLAPIKPARHLWSHESSCSTSHEAHHGASLLDDTVSTSPVSSMQHIPCNASRALPFDNDAAQVLHNSGELARLLLASSHQKANGLRRESSVPFELTLTDEFLQELDTLIGSVVGKFHNQLLESMTERLRGLRDLSVAEEQCMANLQEGHVLLRAECTHLREAVRALEQAQVNYRTHTDSLQCEISEKEAQLDTLREQVRRRDDMLTQLRNTISHEMVDLKIKEVALRQENDVLSGKGEVMSSILRAPCTGETKSILGSPILPIDSGKETMAGLPLDISGVYEDVNATIHSIPTRASAGLKVTDTNPSLMNSAQVIAQLRDQMRRMKTEMAHVRRSIAQEYKEKLHQANVECAELRKKIATLEAELVRRDH